MLPGHNAKLLIPLSSSLLFKATLKRTLAVLACPYAFHGS